MSKCAVELAQAAAMGVTITVSGCVDTTNAADVEQSITELRAQHPEGRLVLDAAGLEYISSVGLRVIMRLVKRDPGVSLVNASSDVYEVFEMTGFVNLLSVKRAPRELSIEGLEEIGRGATATVYRLDPETAVKVFKPGMLQASIEDETSRCRAAFIAGIPTTIPFDTVKVGDCYGSVIELLEAKNLAAGGMGHPIFDMVSMYSLFMVSSASEEQRMQKPHLRSFSLEECHLIWRTFISTYLDTTDEALIRKAEGQIAALTNARVILAAIAVPGLLTPERQRRLIDGACQAVDAGLEPICFG